MISIGLYDPGMFTKTVEAPSWDDVPKALEAYNRTYTTALFSENGRPAGSASRKVGESKWTIRRRAS